MATGWSCPECGLVLAPHVNEHRCDPPSGGVAVRPVVAPYSPSDTSTLPYPQTVTVTPGTTYWSGTVGGGGGGGGSSSFPGDSVTVTAMNAGAWRNGTLALAPGQPRPACNPYGDCGHNSCAVFPRPGLALVTDPAA